MSNKVSAKEITNSLGDALVSLHEYVKVNRAEQGSSDKVSADDVVKIISNYIGLSRSGRGNKEALLDFCVEWHFSSKHECEYRDAKYETVYGLDPGRLMSALSMLKDYETYRRLPEKHHLSVLSKSALALLSGVSNYFGQEVGMPHPERKKKLNKNKPLYSKMLYEVIRRNYSDPKRYPLDEGTFEEVSSSFGLESSGSTLKEKYYKTHEGKVCQEVLKVMKIKNEPCPYNIRLEDLQ